jgi:hypothetical protein
VIATLAYALDNLTRLHLQVPAWPVLYAPLLATLAIAATRVTAGTPLAPAIGVGLAALVLSLVIHAVQLPLGTALGWWPAGDARFELWYYQVVIAVKEGTELAGWVLFAPALAYRGLLPKAALRSRPPSSSAAEAGSTSCAPAVSSASGDGSSSRSPASAIRRAPAKR